MDDRRVLVTGGLGFVGVATVERLLDRGATVRVLDDASNASPDRLPDGATFARQDIRAEQAADELRSFAPTDLVHLAAIHYIPECNRDPERTFEVNVMGTRRLLGAARDVDALGRVVFASTAAVYPPAPGALAETVEPGPMDVYGRTKLVGEDLCRLFHADAGVDTTAARLFNVYGPGETNPHLVPAIVEQVADGGTTVELGNLEPRRDFVHVRDAAAALVAMLDGPGGYRTYNVGTGEARSVRAVAGAVGSALGKDLDVEQAQERVRESDRPHLEADSERARAELDWEPSVAFVEGLREVLAEAGVDT